MGRTIRDWSELAERLATHRARGERIVSTNGVFDVLHVGHLRSLQAARAMGDLLIVGINTDACVRRLKGALRPIVPEEERAEMLAGLSCVDYVTFFEEPNPSALLAALRPDLHTKGGDYEIEAMPETAIVRGYGGEVSLLPFVADHSTTDVIERILAAYRE